jgi:probable rRNA maturation factor
VVGKALVPYLRRHLRAAHALLRPPLREFSLALVGDRAMSDLHEQFLNIAGPTDVLTFPLDEGAAGHVSAGEVVVCVPEARRRAKAEGTDLERETLLYALHGMLHLCGYDDQTDRQYARMHKAEDAILKELGVGAVFRPGRDRTVAAKGRRTKAQPPRTKIGESGRKISPAKPTSQVRRRPGVG